MPRQKTPKTTRTKTVRTARLAKAIELEAGNLVQLNAKAKARTLTAALPTDRPEELVLKFESGGEQKVRTYDDVIVIDVEKVEVPV